MTKFILKAKKENYNRWAVLIPTKEIVINSLKEYFKAGGKTEDYLLEQLKKDNNVEIKIKEDSVSKNSVLKKPETKKEVKKETVKKSPGRPKKDN